MSDPAGPAVRRYLTSKKNLVGMAGAVVGVGLNIAGLVGDVWPVVAIGLYGVGALVTPADPPPPPPERRLTDILRDEVDQLRARTLAARAQLPPNVEHRVDQILGTVRLVLDRLDQVADAEADRIAAPERLADAAEILRAELPACLDAFLHRPPTTPQDLAVGELTIQIDLVRDHAHRLADQVPDVHARRTKDLTDELRDRHDEG